MSWSRSRSRSVSPGPEHPKLAEYPVQIKVEVELPARARTQRTMGWSRSRSVTPGAEHPELAEYPEQVIEVKVEPHPLRSFAVSAIEKDCALKVEESEAEDMYLIDTDQRWFGRRQEPLVSANLCRTLETATTASVARSAQCEPQPGPSGCQLAPVAISAEDARSPPSKVSGRREQTLDEDSDFTWDNEDKLDVDEYAALVGRERDVPDEEELDDPERVVVENIANAMDDAVDRLVDTSTEFTWHEDFDTFTGKPEVFSGPTPGPIKDYDTPYDVFTDIWSRDIMERIVVETNRYANQTIDALKAAGELSHRSRVRRWTDTDVDEMYVFFAIHILMGIDQRISQHEYWETSGYLQMSNFRQLMSYSRYVLLNKFIHFVDNCDASHRLPQYEGVMFSARLAKIAPILEHLNSKFSKLYNLQKDIAINESLTLFKGNLSSALGIRSKAARFGMKSFELCEPSTGYMSKFDIYTGKDSESTDTVAPSVDLADKSARVVLHLLKGLEHRGHLLTMNNYYNCPSLARYLKSLGFDNLGTMRPNRKHVPVQVAEMSKTVPKGTIVARHCGDLSCIAWKNSRVVTMISTYHTNETFAGARLGRDLVKPTAVLEYNSIMGGVYLKDKMLSTYLVERSRCVKWYVKIFKRLLNVSVFNAFIMVKESLKRRDKSCVSHRDFRKELATSLAVAHSLRQPAPQDNVAPASESLRLRKDLVHIPEILQGNYHRSRCHICSRYGRNTIVNLRCVTCDEFICPGICWKIWHLIQPLPGKDVITREHMQRHQ